MTQPFDYRNRLRRDGTSQSQRRPDALDPSSVGVDEREVDDFLVFALRFASQVIYRDLDNEDHGQNWEGFFQCDPSPIIAAIANKNPLADRQAVRTAVEGPAKPVSLRQLFDHIPRVMQLLSDWRQGVGTATDFREQIDRFIKANLKGTLPRLVGYHRAAAQEFSHEISFAADDYGRKGFAAVWWEGSEHSDPSTVTPDTQLFGGFEDPQEQIGAAQSRLDELFAPVYRVLLKVIELAPGYFDRDLASRSDVEPHLALFIAFLRLYLEIRDDANKLGQRHLEFFYEQVLGIKRRPAVADHLHIIVELARQVESEHQVATGTELDAGKDQIGVELRYDVDTDLVANKAQIESFRTVFVDDIRPPDGVNAPPSRPIGKRVVAAPIANSGNGKGAEIEDKERPSWPTLGDRTIPEATLGFAIASRALLMAEGTRTINLELHGKGFPKPGTPQPPNDAFIIQLSGEKGWIEPDAVTLDVLNVAEKLVNGQLVQTGMLKLGLTLESTAEAVTFADEEALGESFGTTDPIVKVTLDPSKLAYDVFKDLRLDHVTLVTNANDLTSVIVQNDQFAMDASKPFQPFGPSPIVGSNFYVGSAEAFEKKLTKLTFDIVWDGLPNLGTYYEGYDVAQGHPARSAYKVESQFLQDGNWKPETVVSKDDLFPTTASAISIIVRDLNGQQPRVIDELPEWTKATQHGFVRLSLKVPGHAFFHDKFVGVLTRQTLAVARMPKCTSGAKYKKDAVIGPCSGSGNVETGQVPIIPNEPYTPTIKEFKLSYEASIDSKSSNNALTFFHIEPFGYQKLPLPKTATDGTESPVIADPPPLLPQFDHQGTLYLGLSNLKPLQSVSILFQVAEATADADVSKPEDHVKWSYLADNRWLEFKEFEITSDTTRGLISSGIITFSIPREITTGNTLLPGGFAWLRAAVVEGAGGVSELINAHTQAVRATFVDQGNDPNHLASPLPAETVAGLVADNAAVAGIAQPYDSFGGRPVEDGLAFYTRVAEHLRHKGRPITLFDYERIVLENFPKIYKAKCVNHTNASHAIAPGHVMIAVIPDFRQLKAVDRRKPKVTVDDLDEITTFLESINCPFVRNDRGDDRQRLHVKNPLYEVVRVDFKVRFRADVTALEFFSRKLNTAINQFLSPWAFEDGAEITFGGRVYKSSILNFVEEQTYVDFVIDFKMKHEGSQEDLDAIEAETPRSILIPSETHGVDPITAKDLETILKPKREIAKPQEPVSF